jgi:hypothetical protein
MRERPKDDRELMQQTGIQKTEEFVTPDDIRKAERKRLGRNWGRKRAPMKGWPR